MLQRRPELGVLGVLERDDGVEAVVAAGELDDDEDGVLARRLVGGAARAVRPRKVGTVRPQATRPRQF